MVQYHQQLIEPGEKIIFDKRHSLWEIWKNFLIGAGAIVALVFLLTTLKPSDDAKVNWGYIILVSAIALFVAIVYGIRPLFKRRNLPERNLFLPLLWMILAVGGWIALVLLEDNKRFGDVWTTVVAIAFVVVIAGWLLYPILGWYFTHFVLTDRRLLLSSGVLNKKTKAIPLDQVNDISGSQNIWERLFDYGDVVIESAGEFGQQPFTNISRPLEVKRQILEQRRISEERQERKHEEETDRQLTDVPRPGAVAPQPAAVPETGVVERLEKLTELHRTGALTDEEFQKAKEELLGKA